MRPCLVPPSERPGRRGARSGQRRPSRRGQIATSRRVSASSQRPLARTGPVEFSKGLRTAAWSLWQSLGTLGLPGAVPREAAAAQHRRPFTVGREWLYIMCQDGRSTNNPGWGDRRKRSTGRGSLPWPAARGRGLRALPGVRSVGGAWHTKRVWLLAGPLAGQANVQQPKRPAAEAREASPVWRFVLAVLRLVHHAA